MPSSTGVALDTLDGAARDVRDMEDRTDEHTGVASASSIFERKTPSNEKGRGDKKDTWDDKDRSSGRGDAGHETAVPSETPIRVGQLWL